MTERKIGYGSPPISGQFKKGFSGNPSGRPKRNKAPLAAEIETVLQRPAEYFEKGRRKSAPNNEVLVKRLIQLAINGQAKAADLIIDMHAQARSGGSNSRIEVVVEGWLSTFPGQTGEQKTLAHRTETASRLIPTASKTSRPNDIIKGSRGE